MDTYIDVRPNGIIVNGDTIRTVVSGYSVSRDVNGKPVVTVHLPADEILISRDPLPRSAPEDL